MNLDNVLKVFILLYIPRTLNLKQYKNFISEFIVHLQKFQAALLYLFTLFFSFNQMKNCYNRIRQSSFNPRLKEKKVDKPKYLPPEGKAFIIQPILCEYALSQSDFIVPYDKTQYFEDLLSKLLMNEDNLMDQLDYNQFKKKYCSLTKVFEEWIFRHRKQQAISFKKAFQFCLQSPATIKIIQPDFYDKKFEQYVKVLLCWESEIHKCKRQIDLMFYQGFYAALDQLIIQMFDQKLHKY